ncbi:helix-turn-helix domain-containing protein [Desmospora profundinema]|uniref:Transcriptional regulator with XRE-family HTH domain n=1 Tax=Desmospora profundinema TaxID=1571184 RepID=A0ABU1IPC4_9BACL|nr:helix-turn-helix transcriptional regulator [Desmospora profundinema]MDR6226640.1 transcriptional regulator with XRE-family HTH domain [Desmospora profundinema]
MSLGKRLRTLRMRRKMRQEDIANLLEISKSAVGMYERGDREPSLETLRKLADLYGVTTDFLLGRTVHSTDVLGDSYQEANLREFLEQEELHWDHVPLTTRDVSTFRHVVEWGIQERKAVYRVSGPRKRKENNHSD